MVTERGIAVNPRRVDLLDELQRNKTTLPIRPIHEVQAEVERICGGKPALPNLSDNPIAVVKWVDGTLLDTCWQVL